MGMQLVLYHPLVTSPSSLVAPVICNIIVLISKRGVAHTVDTYDPYVPLFNDPRNLHIKFHLNTLCRSVYQAPKKLMDLSQTDNTSLFMW